METAFVITPHVINTLNALPEQERLAVASALAVELLLGAGCNGELTPMQEVIYAMISQYVHRDTQRYNDFCHNVSNQDTRFSAAV